LQERKEKLLFADDVASDDQALDFAGASADGASASRRTGGENNSPGEG
jgi:hypothetical protein